MKLSDKNKDVFQAIRQLNKYLRYLQKESIFCDGVTFTQFNILDYIAENDGLELADLHQKLGVEKSTTTRLLDPLVKRRLVQKDRSSRDPRGIALTMTPVGKETYLYVLGCVNGFLQLFDKFVPDGKREPMLDGLRTFIDTLSHVTRSKGL